MQTPILNVEQQNAQLSIKSVLQDLKTMELCMGSGKKTSSEDFIWITPFYDEENMRHGSIFYTEDDSNMPFYRWSENVIAHVPICIHLKDIKPIFAHKTDVIRDLRVLIPQTGHPSYEPVGFISAQVNDETHVIKFTIVEEKDIPSTFKHKYFLTYKHFIDSIDIVTAGVKTEPDHLKQPINIKFISDSQIVMYMGFDKFMTYSVIPLKLYEKVTKGILIADNIEFINYGTARHFVKAARLFMPAPFSDTDCIEIKEGTVKPEGGSVFLVDAIGVSTAVTTNIISSAFFSSWDTLQEEIQKKKPRPDVVLNLDAFDTQLKEAFNFYTSKLHLNKHPTEDWFISTDNGTYIILQAKDGESYHVLLSQQPGKFTSYCNFYNFYLYISACKRSGYSKVGLFTTPTAIIVETPAGAGIVFIKQKKVM